MINPRAKAGASERKRRSGARFSRPLLATPSPAHPGDISGPPLVAPLLEGPSIPRPVQPVRPIHRPVRPHDAILVDATRRAIAASTAASGGPTINVAWLHQWRMDEGAGQTVYDRGLSETLADLTLGIDGGTSNDPTWASGPSCLDVDATGPQLLHTASVPADFIPADPPNADWCLAWVASMMIGGAAPAFHVILRGGTTGATGPVLEARAYQTTGGEGAGLRCRWRTDTGVVRMAGGEGVLASDQTMQMVPQGAQRWGRFQLRIVGAEAQLWINGMILSRWTCVAGTGGFTPTNFDIGADYGTSGSPANGATGSVMWAGQGLASANTADNVDAFMMGLIRARESVSPADTRYTVESRTAPAKLRDVEYTPATNNEWLYWTRLESDRNIEIDTSGSLPRVSRWYTEGGPSIAGTEVCELHQTNAASRPFLLNDGSHDYLDFDGTKSLSGGPGTGLVTWRSSARNRVLLFAVVSVPTFASQSSIIGTDNSSGNVELRTLTDGTLRVIDGSIFAGSAGDLPFDTKVLIVWDTQRSIANRVYVNGGTAKINAGAGSNSGNGMRLGGYSGPTLTPIRFYDLHLLRAPCTSDVTGLINNFGSSLAAFHGLPWTHV